MHITIHFRTLLVFSLISSPLYGGKNVFDETTISNDTYSLAPLVQDSDTAFYASANGASTLHTFDSADESGGTNLLGTEGGTFLVSEETVSISDGVNRIVVKVTAVSSVGAAEPWVDQSNAGEGFISWRLDVGSTAGGTDPIQPDVPFTLLDSGFTVFNSAGESLGSFELTTDTSNATSLSGVAALGNNDQDIAGVDISSIQMFWEISSGPNAPVFIDGFE